MHAAGWVGGSGAVVSAGAVHMDQAPAVSHLPARQPLVGLAPAHPQPVHSTGFVMVLSQW